MSKCTETHFGVMLFILENYPNIYDIVLFDTVNGHRKQQLSHTENQQNTVSFSNFIDARLTYNKVWVSSQVFYVPLGRSSNAGIGAEDQHSFIVPERCQPPAPHDNLTLRPRQCIQ